MGGDGAMDEGPGEPGSGSDRFGWWPSPWSAATVAAGKVSRSGLMTDGVDIHWSESRPGDGGRQVVVRAGPGTAVTDVSPPGVSVRTRVHEYGGGAATVVDGVLFYVDQADQHWYRHVIGGGSAPVPLMPAGDADGYERRGADGRLTPSGRWLISVEERHLGGRTDHQLVALAVPPAEGHPGRDGEPSVVPLVTEGDFVAAPRISPDGRWLAWTTWDHPAMPWDSSEVWVAWIEESAGTIRLVDAHRVAGGPGTSVGQPRWCGDGSLLFVDDRTGWWLPYRVEPDWLVEGTVAGVEPLVDADLEAEFHAPDWVLGQSTLAELADGTIVGRMHREGRDTLVALRAISGSEDLPRTVETIDQPCTSISAVVATGSEGVDRVYVLGSTATEAQAVFEVAVDGGTPPRRLSAAPLTTVTAADVSVAVPFTALTDAGPIPGLFYAPVRTSDAVPSGGSDALPPLVVFCHGGPTSAAEQGFDPVVQFFTSRGLAVAVVDYRGSTGYGREYRRRLNGLWGEADVDDCTGYAEGLAQAGRVDGDRMAIRGTSAGGLTALGALIRGRRFAGAAAWYGVTDLEALAADTHDFESRYVDSLIGPWPEAAPIYRDRSPLHHPDRMSGAVLLLQGADDPVVPADQSERFAALLEEHHVPCRLTVFDGESHGFRRAATIEAALTAELEFYRWLFRPPGADGPPGGGVETDR
jgi:dipeptidyl aminopeptidase/acylaminoacyl peptidase